MKVFTAAQMREFDKAATEEYSIPSIVLMENAALRVVEFLEMKFGPLRDKRVLVLCGKGNNGGDGFAIARHLCSVGCMTYVVRAANPSELKGDALINYEALMKCKVWDNIKIVPDKRPADGYLPFEEANEFPADLYIDAFLGTGYKGGNEDLNFFEVFDFYQTAHAPCIAVDIPSALNADTGEANNQAVAADYTITFAAPKRGMFLRDGLRMCGEIWVGSIGTSESQMRETKIDCECITRDYAHELIPQRPIDSHKGDAGRVILIGGSIGMSGAPTLATKAVLKSGAGLCIAALPEKIIPTFAAAFSEATSHPLPCSARGALTEEAAEELPELWKSAHAVAIGPGIGRDESTFKLVQRVVRECPHPLIIDADALYALRAIEDDLKKREAPTILTPHPGEMSELMEMKASEVNDNRIETAIACAEKFNAIVVLKGSRSIVALPDGNTHINLTGNSGMATGGSGDCLTGTIAGLLAQTKDATNATVLGVYVHGLAGDLAFAEKGNGLIAGDIAENLPRALLEVQKPIEPPVNARLRKLE